MLFKRSVVSAFLCLNFVQGVANASSICAAIFLRAPLSVQELVSNLTQMNRNSASYATKSFGHFYLKTGSIQSGASNQKFGYRIAMSVEGSDKNPNQFTLSRRVDFDSDFYDAKESFLNQYRAKAKNEFEAIAENQILEAARRLASHYDGFEGKFGQDLEFTNQMIRDAKSGLLDSIAKRYMKADATAEFARQKLDVDFDKDPMLLNRWLDYKLNEIIRSAEHVVGLKYPLENLKEAIDVQGGVDLFGAPVETFATSPGAPNFGSARGPYTNNWGERKMTINLPEDAKIRTDILLEVQRFIFLIQN